jgi:hypothetical protein
VRDSERSWRETLRNARGDVIGVALEGLCELELETIKSKLLDAQPDEVLELQGEGRAIRRILKYLTERPLPQPTRIDKPPVSNL